MILDEAIKHAEEVAEEKEKEAWEAQLQEEYKTSKYCKVCAKEHRQLAEWLKDYKRLKEQEPCKDAISRQAVIDVIEREQFKGDAISEIEKLPPVNPQETVTEFADRCRECGKMKRCKDCKYFEYDSVAKVDGIPLIVAHEICSKWGKGCKTSENGYCFLFEPKEEEREVDE